jgi:hypothetical protein
VLVNHSRGLAHRPLLGGVPALALTAGVPLRARIVMATLVPPVRLAHLGALALLRRYTRLATVVFGAVPDVRDVRCDESSSPFNLAQSSMALRTVRGLTNRAFIVLIAAR